MRPSASKLPLLDLCAHWAREDVQSDPRQQNKYSDKGNAFHGGIDPVTAADPKPIAALAAADQRDVRAWLKTWDRSAWSKTPWEHEAPFAFDTEKQTGRRLPKDAGGRGDYSGLKPTEIAGTADLVYFDGDLLTVADLKTGWQADRNPVEVNGQLRFLAMTIASALGATRARSVVLDVGAEVEAEAADFDSFDLAAIASHVTSRVEAIPTSQPQPGPHCSDLYCPALGNCPATKALAEQATTDLAAFVPPAVAAPLAGFRFAIVPKDDAHAVQTREALSTFRDMLDRVEAGLKGYVEQRGRLALPNGKVWTKTEVQMESISLDGANGAEAEQILAEAGVAGAIERTAKASKDAVKEALREALGLKGKALDAALEEKVLIPLRRINATKQWAQPKWAEKKA